FPCPRTVEGKACKHQEQSDGGPAGALEPDVKRESKRASDENARDPGIAPAAIGARQIGLGLAHAKQRHDGKSVKNPSGKNKKICQLFECSSERHHTCQHALKNE